MKRLAEHKREAYENAIDSLARYKFMQFGYWAAIWVHFNQIDEVQESNPFRPLVLTARDLRNADKVADEAQLRFEELPR